MAIYNLSYSKLESLLDRSFSPGTENAIIDAIKSAGIITPSSKNIGVDVVDTSGAHTLPSGVQILLDTGASNNLLVETHGATLIAAGDGSVGVVDQGPGGDTLVGGAGAESLKVTHGENVLIAGSGENTLVGGAGNDTLIGGGSSLLEAGSGGSVLIGGLAERSGGGDGSGDHGRSHGCLRIATIASSAMLVATKTMLTAHTPRVILTRSEAVGHVDGRTGRRFPPGPPWRQLAHRRRRARYDPWRRRPRHDHWRRTRYDQHRPRR